MSLLAFHLSKTLNSISTLYNNGSIAFNFAKFLLCHIINQFTHFLLTFFFFIFYNIKYKEIIISMQYIGFFCPHHSSNTSPHNSSPYHYSSTNSSSPFFSLHLPIFFTINFLLLSLHLSPVHSM